MGKVREGDVFFADGQKYTVIAKSDSGKYILERAIDEEKFMYCP